MLDTSYGFNNLLKEVSISTFRATSTSLASKKLYSRTSMPAKKSAPKSNALSDPMVTLHSIAKCCKHSHHCFQLIS